MPKCTKCTQTCVDFDTLRIHVCAEHIHWWPYSCLKCVKQFAVGKHARIHVSAMHGLEFGGFAYDRDAAKSAMLEEMLPDDEEEVQIDDGRPQLTKVNLTQSPVWTQRPLTVNGQITETPSTRRPSPLSTMSLSRNEEESSSSMSVTPDLPVVEQTEERPEPPRVNLPTTSVNIPLSSQAIAKGHVVPRPSADAEPDEGAVRGLPSSSGSFRLKENAAQKEKTVQKEKAAQREKSAQKDKSAEKEKSAENEKSAQKEKVAPLPTVTDVPECVVVCAPISPTIVNTHSRSSEGEASTSGKKRKADNTPSTVEIQEKKKTVSPTSDTRTSLAKPESLTKAGSPAETESPVKSESSAKSGTTAKRKSRSPSESPSPAPVIRRQPPKTKRAKLKIDIKTSESSENMLPRRRVRLPRACNSMKKEAIKMDYSSDEEENTEGDTAVGEVRIVLTARDRYVVERHVKLGMKK